MGRRLSAARMALIDVLADLDGETVTPAVQARLLEAARACEAAARAELLGLLAELWAAYLGDADPTPERGARAGLVARVRRALDVDDLDRPGA